MYKKFALLSCLVVFLGACNRPLGNHRLAKVGSDGYLIGPWDSRKISESDLTKADLILGSAERRCARVELQVNEALQHAGISVIASNTTFVLPERIRTETSVIASNTEFILPFLVRAKRLLNAQPPEKETLNTKLQDSLKALNERYKEKLVFDKAVTHIGRLLARSTTINKLNKVLADLSKLNQSDQDVIARTQKATDQLTDEKDAFEKLKKVTLDDLKKSIPDVDFFETKQEATYTIQFDNAFFKYLQDTGNSSEVLIVLSFEDVGSTDSEIVKVFGPVELVPDATLSRTISRVTYGPKPLRGAYTKVKIQVIEYDVAERENRANFLNFVSDLSSSVAIADPTTAAEIKLAAEIGKFINSLDKNDLILDFRFDLIPPLEGEERPLGIPLDKGQYVLIKQEHEGFLASSFFGISRKVNSSRSNLAKPFLWLFTVPFDIAFTPFTITAGLIADEPDQESLTDLTYKKIEKTGTETAGTPSTLYYHDAEKPLRFDQKRRELYLKTDEAKRATYSHKTWIAFSVEMGRDAKLWDAKQEALRTQKLVDKFLKDGDQTSIEGAKAALEGLLTTLKDEKTKKKLKGQSATIQTLIDNIDKELKADPAPKEEEKAKLEASKGYLEDLLKSLNEKSEK